MSAVSISSAQSVGSSQHISQRFINEIGIKLQSPLTVLATKQISLDTVLECDRASPEAALISMTKHEVRRIQRDCSTLSLEEKKVIDSCRCIMQFISENQPEINKLRVLRREDNSSYQAALASCNPLSTEVINFLTNAPGDVNDCYDRYKDILEEALHDLNSASKSDKIESDGSDVNKPSEPSLKRKRQSDPISEEALHDLNSASESDKIESDGSDVNKPSEPSLKSKRRSGPINQDLLLSFLSYRHNLVLGSYKDIFRMKPEHRIQMLIILISKYQLKQMEVFVLMKKMKEYEKREQEFMTDEEKNNVQFNDYYSKIAYRDGMPFLIEEQQLPGAVVSNLKYVPIPNYYDLGKTHSYVVMSEAFLKRVNDDLVKRSDQPRTHEIWLHCANYVSGKTPLSSLN